MARYPVVSSGTIDLTFPGTQALIACRDLVVAAEELFYESCRQRVNSYPGKVRDITLAEIESAYDGQLGNKPWAYASMFTASGSTLKTDSYPSYNRNPNNLPNKVGRRCEEGIYQQFYSVNEARNNTATIYWVADYKSPGTTPTAGYPEIYDQDYNSYTASNVCTADLDSDGNQVIVDVNGPWSFNTARGAAFIDLITTTGGYNNGFTSKGTESVWTNSSSYKGTQNYFPTIGVIPYAYNQGGNLTAFEAHMLKLIGDEWESKLRPLVTAYTTEYTAYTTYYAQRGISTFTSNSATGVWNNYEQISGAAKYNRPGTLNSKLINEARGINR